MSESSSSSNQDYQNIQDDHLGWMLNKALHKCDDISIPVKENVKIKQSSPEKNPKKQEKFTFK